MVHCVQTLPSDGSKVICSKPFRCCFIFCLFLLHLGQSVEKLKGEESMKVSFGFTEAGADYFTRKSLFHLFIYFYLKRIWDSLQHFRIATPAYFIPQCGFSTSEQVRFFSLLQWTASKRDTATPHVDLSLSEAALLCLWNNKSHQKSQGLGSNWDSRADSLQPLCRGDPFAQLKNSFWKS